MEKKYSEDIIKQVITSRLNKETAEIILQSLEEYKPVSVNVGLYSYFLRYTSAKMEELKKSDPEFLENEEYIMARAAIAISIESIETILSEGLAENYGDTSTYGEYQELVNLYNDYRY